MASPPARRPRSSARARAAQAARAHTPEHEGGDAGALARKRQHARSTRALDLDQVREIGALVADLEELHNLVSVLGDRNFGAGILDLVRDLGRGQGPVDRHVGGPEIDGGEVRILNDDEVLAKISNPEDILHF